MTSGGLVIELRELRRSYRDAERSLEVIQGVSHRFPSSGSVAILGRSGIGKTTLLHLLAGLDRPSSGEVNYGDTRIDSLGDEALSDFRGKNIGFVFQFHHLLPEFSALENVSMPLIIAGITEAEAEQRASELLIRVNLESRLSHRPGQLSGGEQQRVAIARALVARPKVILADEPTGNLDLETAAEVQSLLLEVNAELENVLVVVTHNRALATQMDVVLEMMPGGHLKDVTDTKN